MAGKLRGLCNLGLVVAVTLLAAQAASGQEISRFIRIKKLRGEKVRSPEYKIIGGTTQTPPRDWFEMRVQYETAPDWVDELSFQFFALVKGPGEGGKTRLVLFQGGHSYVNIAKGSHQCVAYLHPNTLARYGSVERVAVGITLRGQTAWESEPSGSQRWWESLPPVPGFVLSRMETPFALMNFDDFEAMKAATPR